MAIASHSEHGNCSHCLEPKRLLLVGGCACPCAPCQHKDRFGQQLLEENRKTETGQLRESWEHFEAATPRSVSIVFRLSSISHLSLSQ